MQRYSSYQSPSSTNDDMSVLDPPAPTKSRTPLYVGVIGISTMILLLLALSMSGHSSEYSLTSLTQRNNPAAVCENPKYSKTTLKLAQEMSAIALFKDLKGQKKFEASSIIHVGQYFYIAFDNIWSLGRVAEHLPIHSEDNILIGSPGIDSGFEALVYDDVTETFYIVIETRPHIDKKRVEANMKNSSHEALTVTGREEQYQDVDEEDPNAPKYHAVIQEVRLSSGLRGVTAATQEYEVIRSCDTEKEFTSGNKGLEGAAHVNIDGKLYILGLCEGNFCAGGRKGKTSGNGRIIVMTANYDAKDNPNGCEWKTQKEIHLPKEIDFVDYSALTLRKTSDPNVYRMAVATQEGAQVWIGTLNIDTWQVGSGKLYNFPRNDNCDIIFCNVEGLHWLGDDMFVAVSDKMKSGGKQPFHCLPHDQSVHIFVLP